MEKLIQFLAFAAVAVALIYGGVRYNERQDGHSKLEQAALDESRRVAHQALIDSLKIEDTRTGTGAEARTGDTLRVHYTGTLADGTKFDSSYDRGEPIEFVIGRGDVIQGWELGLLGMKEGGRRTLTVPPELGYGNMAVGPVPANSTLIFKVELVEVKK